jgi:hypothetical protein
MSFTWTSFRSVDSTMKLMARLYCRRISAPRLSIAAAARSRTTDLDVSFRLLGMPRPLTGAETRSQSTCVTERHSRKHQYSGQPTNADLEIILRTEIGSNVSPTAGVSTCQLATCPRIAATPAQRLAPVLYARVMLRNNFRNRGRGCNSCRLHVLCHNLFDDRDSRLAETRVRFPPPRRRGEARTDRRLRVRTTQAPLLKCLACLVSAVRPPFLSSCLAGQITHRRRESRHYADIN